MRLRFCRIMVVPVRLSSFLIFTVSLILTGILARAPQKIVRGNDARIIDFPSTVVIQRTSGRHLCGGTLITSTHVLTAAHCLTDGSKPEGTFLIASPSAIRVISGHDNLENSHNLEYNHKLADSIDIHPNWEGEIDTGNSEGDIAIVTLSSGIPETEVQKVAKLPDSDIKAGSPVTVVGWGITTDDDTGEPSDKLQKADLTVIDYHFCKAHRDKFVPQNVICAEGSHRDVAFCLGDSGGPLYNSNNEVIGVVSYNYDCTGKEENVFTDVFHYEPWIQEVLRYK